MAQNHLLVRYRELEATAELIFLRKDLVFWYLWPWELALTAPSHWLLKIPVYLMEDRYRGIHTPWVEQSTAFSLLLVAGMQGSSIRL